MTGIWTSINTRFKFRVGQYFQCLFTLDGQGDVMANGIEHGGDHFPVGRIVINQQDAIVLLIRGGERQANNGCGLVLFWLARYR